MHRLLAALESHELIGHNEETGRYHLGLRLFSFGTRAVVRVKLREVVAPYLLRLMRGTEETVHLAILEGSEVLYLEKVEGSHALRMPSQVGRKIPAYCTSLGKAILSYLDQHSLRAVLPKEPFPAFTPKTIRTARELMADFAATRARGYAVDDEETELGLRCVGAPLWDYSGSMVGAISVAAPAARLTETTIPDVGQLVVEVARSISKELGYGHVEGVDRRERRRS